MVNLLRYRAEADYEGRTALPPCSGRGAYLQRYLAAFARVAAVVAPGEAFAPTFVGSVRATLVVPDGEAWDDVAVVAYPSFAVLRRIIESPAYEAEAAPHRRAGRLALSGDQPGRAAGVTAVMAVSACTRGAVETARHRTAWLEAGPAHGPQLTTLHGSPELGPVWRAQRVQLAARRWTCPGRSCVGRSPRPTLMGGRRAPRHPVGGAD